MAKKDSKKSKAKKPSKRDLRKQARADLKKQLEEAKRSLKREKAKAKKAAKKAKERAKKDVATARKTATGKVDAAKTVVEKVKSTDVADVVKSPSAAAPRARAKAPTRRTAAKPVPKAGVPAAAAPNDTWTVAALRAEARKRSVAGYSRLSKTALLDKLK